MDPLHTPAASSSDRGVALCFVRGEPTDGSPELTVEEDALLGGGRIAVAVRPGPAAVFVRADLPGELAGLRLAVEQALADEGLVVLDRNSSLAGSARGAGRGGPSAQWDLWGHDLAEVFAVLSTAASDRPGVGSGHDGPGAALAVEAGAVTESGRRRRLSPPRIAAMVAAAALLVTGLSYLVLERDDSKRLSATASTRPSASAVPAALVDYRDPRGRFTLQHPDTWRAVESTDPDVAVLLVGPAGTSMLVRLVSLATAVDPANIADVKAVTDVIVKSETVRILQEKPIEVAGARGYYYLYTFRDASSGQEGVHSHFFLFKGKAMHTLVFQALPTDSFAGQAADFDRIAQSYRLMG